MSHFFRDGNFFPKHFPSVEPGGTKAMATLEIMYLVHTKSIGIVRF